MRYVGLRRRPALAGANGMQTRQARVLWNVRALGNALGVRGGLQGRVLYVKDIWKVKSLNYDSLRFSFFIIMYSHISSVVLCLMFAHISSHFLNPPKKTIIL